MPKGVPAAGFRRSKHFADRVASGDIAAKAIDPNIVAAITQNNPVLNQVEPVIQETDDEIAARIADRFEILKMLTESALTGDARSIIVSGPAGLGKSFTVEHALDQWDSERINYTSIKGYVRTTGLYKMLYRYRNKGQVIVFDDADTIFFDDNSLNLLKAVCDTTDRRVVSYMAETNMIDDETNERLPNQFDFDGTIIFITNLDMDSMIEKGHKLAPHLSALVSRSHYIDLTMHSRREYMVRIKQVISEGMLKDKGLNAEEENDVIRFLDENKDKLRELSLRIALKIASLRLINKEWEKLAKVTCCKG